jgi:IS30 family transposase
LFQTVYDWLYYKRFSPQQIAARLRRMHPDEPQWHVSHETIYATIYAYPRGALKDGLIAALRQGKSARGRRRRATVPGQTVPTEQSIAHRPAEVAKRELPGHWEGDFIKGAFNRSAVGTLVERKTRFVVLAKMEDGTSQAALEGFTRQMKRLPAFLRESLTYDRGSELACHVELAKRLKLDIWFADPHAPWQRGSNENTNGLLRQFLPKGVDLSRYSQTQLNDIARLLNERPRKTLDWQTPNEVMAQELAKFSKNVALDA